MWLGYIITYEKVDLKPKVIDNLKAVFMMEVFGTFIISLFTTNVLSSKTRPTIDGMLASLGTASALYTVILLGGGISSACYNPAVGISLIIFKNNDY